ncbi:MAG: aldehyde dehydrogenase family protein [Tissierellales bacterium]|jgi:acyl-CoA reductase-like NAD-dependent aldehyde dehydrogenase|nr:aldehyde dehydrogenase family protein [Tissierellales bacterium]
MLKNYIDKSYKLYIDGKWVDGVDGNTFESISPVTGEILTTCVEASPADVDLAVAAARKAFKTWKDVTAQERSNILLKIADRLDENAEKFAMIETLDNGKPIRETSAIDVPWSSDHFRYFAGVARTMEGESVMIDPNTLSMILREPIGVVGQIIPWNFPLLMAAWKIAPLIASGNCAVIKPSEFTSISILEFMKLIEDLVPAGVINIVTGEGPNSGDYLRQHEGIDKLAFTGSTRTGHAIADAAAKRLIPATLELGGKSANIYFPDCPWDKAIEGLQLGILFNQGQVCCAGSRVFVHEDIYDKFVAQAIEEFNKVNVGNPLEMTTQMGSLINKKQYEKVLGYIETGKNEGAKVVCGGEAITGGDFDNGYYIQPTLFVDVTNDMTIAREEIFGPVAVIIKFKTEEEVIEMANDTNYGLAGAVWTKDINRAIRVARAVEVGKMWVNDYNNLPAGTPFGGYKQSGLGRETHAMIMEHYTQKKNIMISLSENRLGFY